MTSTDEVNGYDANGNPVVYGVRGGNTKPQSVQAQDIHKGNSGKTPQAVTHLTPEQADGVRNLKTAASEPQTVPKASPKESLELEKLLEEYGLENWSYKAEFIAKVTALLDAEVEHAIGPDLKEWVGGFRIEPRVVNAINDEKAMARQRWNERRNG